MIRLERKKVIKYLPLESLANLIDFGWYYFGSIPIVLLWQTYFNSNPQNALRHLNETTQCHSPAVRQICTQKNVTARLEQLISIFLALWNEFVRRNNARVRVKFALVNILYQLQRTTTALTFKNINLVRTHIDFFTPKNNVCI